MASIESRSFMKHTEELLFGELAVAPEIRPDQVSEYIRTRLNNPKNGILKRQGRDALPCLFSG